MCCNQLHVHRLVIACVLALLAAHAIAAMALAQDSRPVVIFEQDFEDTAVFAPLMRGSAGTINEPGGRWFGFADPAPNISRQVASSGRQCAFVQRAATADGPSLGGLDARRNLDASHSSRYTFAYSIYRADDTSSSIVAVSDAQFSSQSIAVYIDNQGIVRYWDDQRQPTPGYVATEVTIPAKTWVKMDMAIDLEQRHYSLRVTVGDDEPKQAFTSVGLTQPPTLLRAIRMVAQQPQAPANRTYIDDIRLIAIDDADAAQ